MRFSARTAAAALAVLAAATAGAGAPAPAVPTPAVQFAGTQDGAVQYGAVPGRAGQDPCRWHAAAVRLAGSLAGESDPRAERLRAALERRGITADGAPPEGCGGAEQEEPPAERDRGDAAPGPGDGVGRIAVGADGNQHDEDDWASAPMALAILAQRGLQPNLVNFTYDNHIWDSDPTHRENMTESVLGAAERFGFDTSAFHDAADPDGLAAGVADLTAEINASTPDDELTIVIGGPVETTWMALDAADPQARENVRCVSHGEGTFNQTHGATDHGGHSYDDVIDLGCRRVQIPDQNGNLGPTDMSDWDYLLDSGDPDLEWLHSRLELAEKGDVSDAGVTYFAITGEEEPTRADLEALLTGPRTEPPARRFASEAEGVSSLPPRPDGAQEPGDAAGLPPVEVSENGRFLQHPGGRPFFWLADTGWELFHRADREDARLYLDTRAAQGFTVIQAVALAEKGGLEVPTPAGHTPLVDEDPARPDVRPGPDDDYWDDVDYMIDYANAQGLYVALWAAWGSMVQDGPEVLNASNARAYGEFLGERYGGKDVFFVLGGDRESNAGANTPEVWSALAEGIRATDTHDRLISFHPWGEESSTEMFPNDSPVLDFNLIQGSHKKVPFAQLTTLLVEDYGKSPPKPVIDSEVFYEEHPFNWNSREGWKTAVHARGAAYYQVFSGAAGHTYGNGAVHQFWEPGMDAPYEVRDAWQEAIRHEGATQMRHLKDLLLSRSFLDRIPDQSLITSGAGRATRSESGSWAMVYLPEGGSVDVDTSVLASSSPQATWFDPRTGESWAGEAAGAGSYTAPDEQDWVLVLDAP
ncbi:glycoside hydrolase family 140 protein [Pseudonocardia sichuanensis]